ncbi:nuclear pore complex protein 14-like [Oppia nitens]|uniref:nuclear pore complex protein 14-like n=1 Tax=Oppia nitens TaxID=1686743 RepID=UPI0023DA05A5|nr:nuclear pore complex protein 14-like [Oppia nitens]
MSVKSGQLTDNSTFKFLELKKFQLSVAITDGLKCLSVDNNLQQVFVANDTNLSVISFDTLLSYEWNKSVINELCQEFAYFSIPLIIRPNLISVSSNGFGNKIVICGTDGQNESPIVLFYGLSDIYKNQNKSLPYGRINLINANGLVTDIVWHPEYSDSLFACCVSDGSVFTSMNDIDSKTSAILTDKLIDNSGKQPKVLSLCWSPKGKQLVVGLEKGLFFQYKLTPEYQLVFVKKTALINSLNEHNVIAIKWIISSLFAVYVAKDNDVDKDPHLLLVSTPSKSEPIFIDFGAVCYDNLDFEDSYCVNLFQFNNIILCSTSMSSEVTIIGCNVDKDLAVPDNWSQWTLDDSSRIELPIDNEGNETYFKGMVVSKGTQNIYKISATETYGGINCPILFVYNTSGILVPYLMIDKTGHIKSPVLPNIVKPTNLQNKPSLISSPLQQLSTGNKPTATSTPIVGSKLLPQTKSTSLTFEDNSNNVLKAITGPKQLPSYETKQNTTIFKSQTLESNIKQSSQQTVTNNRELKTTQTINRVIHTEDTTKSTNELYMSEIKQQINNFRQLMSETKNKISQMNVKIGEKEQQMKLRNDTKLIVDVLNEVKVNFKDCSKDTTTLHSSLIESFSLIEEAKSIIDRNVDPNYRNLLKQRALDPMTARRMKEIHSLNEYIEIQLRELDAKFEQEWYEWLDKRKVSKGKPTNRIHSKSNLELIYKTLANNQLVINALNLQFDTLESLGSPRLRSKGRSSKDQSPNKSNQKLIENLSHSMSKTTIKDIPTDDLANQRLFKLKSISNEKKTNLRNFFESRTKVPVRRVIDNSSHFVSAIQKIKEKQKDIELSKKLKNSSKSDSIIVNKTTEEQPKQKTQTLKSLDNKVIITPTVIKTQNVDKPINKSLENQTNKQKSNLNINPISISLDTNKIISSKPLLQTNNGDKPKDIFQPFDDKPKDVFQSFVDKPKELFQPFADKPKDVFQPFADKPKELFQSFTDKPLAFSLNPTKVSNISSNTTPITTTSTKPLDNKVTTTPTIIMTKTVDKTINKSPENESINKEKSDFNLNSLSMSLDANKIISSKPLLQTTNNANKSTDVFQTFTDKPLSFSLNSTKISSIPSNTTPMTSTSKSMPILSALITGDSTPNSLSDLSFGKKGETTTQSVPTVTTTSNIGKSVSFGNTTIINPNETINEEESHKLDIIAEVSETNEISSTTSTPFTSFKGFGGTNSSDLPLSKFSSPQQSAQPMFGSLPSFGTQSPAPTFGGSPAFNSNTTFGGSPTFGGNPAFGGNSTFGSSPTFAGNPTFGGSPTFGNSPQQSVFGSAPTFGGQPSIGSAFSNQSTFGSTSGFASAANSSLTFGALASGTQQQQQPTQQTSPFSSGFTGFSGNSDSFSFTQRRK